jgi:Phage integrase SAM-like domain
MKIRKRKENGKWGYQHYFRGKNYRSFVWNTRDEAQKAAEDFLGKLRREVKHLSGSGTSFVDAVNEFMKYSVRIGKSENRQRGLYSNFKSILIPFFGDKRVKDITHLDIDAFIDVQLKRDITKKTIHHYVTDLNALLNWALKEEIIDVNPMIKVVRKRI